MTLNEVKKVIASEDEKMMKGFIKDAPKASDKVWLEKDLKDRLNELKICRSLDEVLQWLDGFGYENPERYLLDLIIKQK